MSQVETEKKLRNKLEKLRIELAKTSEVLKGNLIKLKPKPGVGTKRKAAYQITWKGVGNKTRTLYVPVERLTEVQKMTSAYQKARAALERMADLTADLYKAGAK